MFDKASVSDFSDLYAAFLYICLAECIKLIICINSVLLLEEQMCISVLQLTKSNAV